MIWVILSLLVILVLFGSFWLGGFATSNTGSRNSDKNEDNSSPLKPIDLTNIAYGSSFEIKEDKSDFQTNEHGKDVWRKLIFSNESPPNVVVSGAMSSDLKKGITERFDGPMSHHNIESRFRQIKSSAPGRLVQATIIISGRDCKSRLNATLASLAAWENIGPIYHLDAIWRPNGAEGCMQSHIAALKMAMKFGKNVMIVEDDLQISANNKTFEAGQANVADTVGETRWDMIIVSQFVHDWAKIKNNESLMRIFRTTTTGAYVVRSGYAKKLHDLWEKEHEKIRSNTKWKLGQHEIDQNWSRLSKKDRWYGFIKSMAQQRPSITTIGGTFADNRWIAEPSLRQYRYKGGGDEVKLYPLKLRKPISLRKVAALFLHEKTFSDKSSSHNLEFLLPFDNVSGIDLPEILDESSMTKIDEGNFDICVALKKHSDVTKINKVLQNNLAAILKDNICFLSDVDVLVGYTAEVTNSIQQLVGRKTTALGLRRAAIEAGIVFLTQ